jgi:cell division protein FtsL
LEAREPSSGREPPKRRAGKVKGMEKREKILLVILLIAAAYAAYTYLFAGSEVKSVDDLVNKGELELIKKEVQAKLDENQLTDLERYRLEVAERPWRSDPFYDRTRDIVSEDEQMDTQLPESVELRYTGYIMLGPTVYAIINDYEYQVGDELEISEPGFFLFEITKRKIVIGKKDEVGEIVGQQEIFLEEESL